MTQREQVNALVDLARRTYGRLDVMIDNAGIMQLKLDERERMIDVNIKGVLYGIAAALSVIQEQKSGPFVTSPPRPTLLCPADRCGLVGEEVRDARDYGLTAPGDHATSESPSSPPALPQSEPDGTITDAELRRQMEN